MDGVVEFDQAVRDPERPTPMRPIDDCGDGRHPSDLGYGTMGDAIDPALFDEARARRRRAGFNRGKAPFSPACSWPLPNHGHGFDADQDGLGCLRRRASQYGASAPCDAALFLCHHMLEIVHPADGERRGMRLIGPQMLAAWAPRLSMVIVSGTPWRRIALVRKLLGITAVLPLASCGRILDAVLTRQL